MGEIADHPFGASILPSLPPPSGIAAGSNSDQAGAGFAQPDATAIQPAESVRSDGARISATGRSRTITIIDGTAGSGRDRDPRPRPNPAARKRKRMGAPRGAVARPREARTPATLDPRALISPKMAGLNLCPSPMRGLTLFQSRRLGFYRRGIDGPEHVDNTHVWQMPQWALIGARILAARCANFYEETNYPLDRELGEIENGSLTTLRAILWDRPGRKISRADAEMVRRCDFTRVTRKSTLPIPRADMIPNSWNCGGSLSRTFRAMIVPFSAKSTSGWCGRFAQFVPAL